MKKPLETGHIDRIIRDICEYIEVYDSPNAKRMITYLLDALEADAKRALQKALSISDNLIQYIDSQSDVAYPSNLGIYESDDNYLLSTSICEALYILLGIKSYNVLERMDSEESKISFIETIKELRYKALIYRGIELEQSASYLLERQKIKKPKKPKGLCSQIGKIVEHYVMNDIAFEAIDVWNKIKTEIQKSPERTLKLRFADDSENHLTYEKVPGKATYAIYDYDLATGNKGNNTFKGGFGGHVTAAKKYFKKKKLRSK